MLLYFLLEQISFAETKTIDYIAALVNDEIICWSEIYDMSGDFIQQAVLNPSKLDGVSEEWLSKSIPERLYDSESDVLEALIQQKLVSQEIHRLGLDITDEEMEQALEDVARSNGIPRERLQTEVERSGLSWDAYKTQFKEQMRQMRFNQVVLQPRITIDEDALLNLYQQFAQNQPPALDLGAIFIAGPQALNTPENVAQELQISLEEAKSKLDALYQEQKDNMEQIIGQVYSRISFGEAFSQIAQDLDQGGFGSNGGKMGLFIPGQLRPDLENVAFSLEKGQLSDPICDDRGCLILYAFDYTTQIQQSFEELRPQIIDQYYAERFEQEMLVWTEQTRRRSSVEIRLQKPQTQEQPNQQP